MLSFPEPQHTLKVDISCSCLFFEMFPKIARCKHFCSCATVQVCVSISSGFCIFYKMYLIASKASTSIYLHAGFTLWLPVKEMLFKIKADVYSISRHDHQLSFENQGEEKHITKHRQFIAQSPGVRLEKVHKCPILLCCLPHLPEGQPWLAFLKEATKLPFSRIQAALPIL